MKKFLFLFAVLVLVTQGRPHANTITALSCNFADVQGAIGQANSGDTVIVPAGNCAWSSELDITKGIVLQGAGIGQTIITDQTQKATSFQSSLINWSSFDPTFRLTGFSFIEGVCDCGRFNTGMIVLSGSTHAFRVDHNAFSNINDTITYNSFIRFHGWLLGVIDHNDFRINFQNAVLVAHETWAGSQFGDGSWASPLALGTDQAIYVETNTFTELNPVTTSVLDCVSGGRFVFRNNVVNKSAVATHGTESSQRFRSVRSYEIYNNQFNYPCDATNGCLWAAIFLRGGTGVVWGNTFTNTGIQQGNPPSGYGTMIRLWVDRSDQGFVPWDSQNHDYVSPIVSKCDGSGAFDGNTPGSFGYRCIDQVGSGTSIDLHGQDPPPVTPLQNSLDPIYQWGNNFGGDTNPFITIQGANAGYLIQPGRDYYDNTVKPGYTPLGYPHPLTGGGGPSAPPTPTNVHIIS